MNRALSILFASILSLTARAAINDSIQIEGQLQITGNITLRVSLGSLPAVTNLGNCIWSSHFGGTTINVDRNFPASVKEDGNGNVIAVGQFVGTTIFPGGSSITSTGAADIFVVKYNSSGIYQWSKRIGGIGTDQAMGVAVDSTNNIVVVGSFTSTVDFGGTNLTSAGSSDIFVAKYEPTAGALLWVKGFGGTAQETCNGVAVDSSNNILITGYYGYFGTAVDFGGGALPLSAGTTAFQYDAYITKLNSNGGYVWANGYGGLGNDVGNGIVSDSNGNVIVSGSFQQTLNVGGTNLISSGGYDVFLAKYSSSGVHQWSIKGGGTGNDLGISPTVDSSGFITFTGQFIGTATIGGSVLSSPYNPGLPGMFLTRYSPSGVPVWSQAFVPVSSFGTASGKSVAVDSSRNIVVTGFVQGAVGFGNIYLGAGSTDIVIAKVDDIGTLQWAKAYGTLINDSGTSVSVGASDNILATGNFSVADFGCGTMTSISQTDGFIVKLTP